MARQRRESASAKLQRFGYDPLTYLVHTAQDKEPWNEKKVGIAKELLPYAYPKLKAIEHDVAADGKVTITIGSATSLGKQGEGGDG